MLVCCKKKKFTSMASRFDRQVSLQQLTITKDAIGGITKSFAELKKLWCAIKTKAGNEYYINNKIDEKYSLVLEVEYLSAKALLDSSTRVEWRIVLDSVNYNIVHVENVDMQNKVIKIYCIEGDE